MSTHPDILALNDPHTRRLHEDGFTAEDCAPVFESVVHQKIYMGVWVNQCAKGRFFSVELNDATLDGRRSGFLETADMRRLPSGRITYYRATLAEALTLVGELAEETIPEGVMP